MRKGLKSPKWIIRKLRRGLTFQSEKLWQVEDMLRRTTFGRQSGSIFLKYYVIITSLLRNGDLKLGALTNKSTSEKKGDLAQTTVDLYSKQTGQIKHSEKSQNGIF